MLADEIKKYDTEKLINFLHKEGNLKFSKTALKILENEEVNGRDFLKVTEEKLRSYKMKDEPASRLINFAKKCKDKKLRSFLSYKTKKDLSKMLGKYKIISSDITHILQFKPDSHSINKDGQNLSFILTIFFAE